MTDQPQRHTIRLCIAVLVCAATLPADTIIPSASGVSITGALDPNNPDDVLLVQFSLPAATSLLIQTWGFGGTSNAPLGTNAAGAVIPSGGFDPFVALYSGSGPGATFLDLGDDGICPPGNDFGVFACFDATLNEVSLAAGTYTLALGAYANYPVPWFYTIPGTLGDGFIGLGSYNNTTSDFAVDLLADGISVESTGRFASPVPEPSTGLLLAALLAGMAIRKVRGRRL